ncbi:MAG: polysaccharide deacetylase family protein [Acidobacteria bacterium]|nr:polysaccharide deacetylase family protein [Acidobacteriota bacterium]
MKERYFFISNDVETTSLWNHTLSDITGKKVWKEGMPVLLNLYQKYGIKSTFFFTGHIARLYPDIVRMILPHGHEVGCHGLVHDSDKAFDVLRLEEQIEHLQQSKKILEDISGREVISFRAPAIRVNGNTPKALLETGFRIDSSIASQRLDFMFSFGARHKLKWLLSPRKPYFASSNNLARKGTSKIMEFPINSILLPYVGTFMRISPAFTNVIRCILHYENKLRNTPVSFIIHPNELIDEEITKGRIQRRSKNYLKYLLADKIRYRLKLRNLGQKAIPLLEKQLIYFSQRDYKSITFREYYHTHLDQ